MATSQLLVCVSASDQSCNDEFICKIYTKIPTQASKSSRNIYLVLIFFAGVWPELASAFTSFRSGSCCCSIAATAHKHSSSLWGVQSCWGSTEEEGKLIFKPTTRMVSIKGPTRWFKAFANIHKTSQKANRTFGAYLRSISLPFQPFCPDRECSAWLCTGWALVPVRSPGLHRTWMQPRLERLLPTQLEQNRTVGSRPGLNAAMMWIKTIQLKSSSSQQVLNFHPCASTSTLSSPDAVAGPTPFRELSSAIAAFTSGRRLKAFLEHFSTVSSLLEATSCCSLGLNFPLCKPAQGVTCCLSAAVGVSTGAVGQYLQWSGDTYC